LSVIIKHQFSFDIGSGGPSSFMLLPDFGAQSLANSVMEIDDVLKFQEIMDRFRTSANYSHGFLVGKI
jgi:hypothetical protein